MTIEEAVDNKTYPLPAGKTTYAIVQGYALSKSVRGRDLSVPLAKALLDFAKEKGVRQS